MADQSGGDADQPVPQGGDHGLAVADAVPEQRPSGVGVAVSWCSQPVRLAARKMFSTAVRWRYQCSTAAATSATSPGSPPAATSPATPAPHRWTPPAANAIRHRLNTGGNRQLNAALHTIAVCQARDPGPGRDYYLRKIGEGKTPNEARRALKRRLANVIYRQLIKDQRDSPPTT